MKVFTLLKKYITFHPDKVIGDMLIPDDANIVLWHQNKGRSIAFSTDVKFPFFLTHEEAKAYLSLPQTTLFSNAKQTQIAIIEAIVENNKITKIERLETFFKNNESSCIVEENSLTSNALEILNDLYQKSMLCLRT